MVLLDPVRTLLQRQEFLEGIREIARFSHWTEKQTQEIVEQAWNKLIAVDNATLEALSTVEHEEDAYLIWEEGMEEIRYWLSLVFGVKIEYR